MSQRPIALSPDLKRLRDEGFDIRVEGGYLVTRDIPYLASVSEIRRGLLVCALTLAGDVAQGPGDHTAYFIGAHPCHADGRLMTEIMCQPQPERVQLTGAIKSDFYLSAKPLPAQNYSNFYAKILSYIRRISGPVRGLDRNASAQTYPLIEEDADDSVFLYADTASSRADIVAVSEKLKFGKVAILGLGGTGGYILDLVAKTPGQEIHLFDGDLFLQHNAFRAPGAASCEELREKPFKVDYFAGIYSRMRHGIVPHREYMSEANLNLLDEMDFVFMSMESGSVKRMIAERLLARGIPFIDVGMGVYLKNGQLGGTLRTVTGTARKSDHLWANMPLTDGGLKNEYDKNIQIADLNALHATLAVMKWKKLFGFYGDLRDEHYSTFSIVRNETNNEAFP